MSESSPTPLPVQTVSIEAWRAFSANALPFIVASALAIALTIVTLGLLAGPLLLGLIRMANSALDGNAVEVGHLFRGFDKLGTALLTGLAIAVGTAIGGLLLVLPGLALGLIWLYALWFVERGETLPSVALARSYALTKAHLGETVVLFGSVLVLHLIGGLLVVGTFLALPLSVLAVSSAFRQLNP